MRGVKVKNRAGERSAAAESAVPNPQAPIFNLHFYTDTELFGWSKPQARRRTQKQSKVAAELFFADVKPSDFVVHLEHGIGQFDGSGQDGDQRHRAGIPPGRLSRRMTDSLCPFTRPTG